MTTTSPAEFDAILSGLAAVRPIFHSEADFQFALAWQWRAHVPEAAVRLEYPLPSEGAGRRYADLWVRHAGVTTHVELKCWKRSLHIVSGGETFDLRGEGPQDLARYDFAKDLERVEQVIRSGHADRGFVVALTNDPSYWNPNPRPTADAAFRLQEGRVLAGELAWGPRAGAGTVKGREQAVRLDSRYQCRWAPYSQIGGPHGEFRCLSVAVTRQPFRA